MAGHVEDCHVLHCNQLISCYKHRPSSQLSQMIISQCCIACCNNRCVVGCYDKLYLVVLKSCCMLAAQLAEACIAKYLSWP